AGLSATSRSAASMIQKSARYFSFPTWVGLGYTAGSGRSSSLVFRTTDGVRMVDVEQVEGASLGGGEPVEASSSASASSVTGLQYHPSVPRPGCVSAGPWSTRSSSTDPACVAGGGAVRGQLHGGWSLTFVVSSACCFWCLWFLVFVVS